MYEKYFGVTKNPFLLTPDPSFLYLTESHQEALAGLTYAVTAKKGFVVLSGEAGTGKTTLLHTLLNRSPKCHFSLVLNPSLTPSEFLEFLMYDFGIDLARITNKAQRLVALYTFLVECHRRGQTPVLVVDEAHRLDPPLLEEIRLLTNFESSVAKLLQIVLVGQAELDRTLDRPDLRQLKQRIAVRLRIRPLNLEEVERYISHRWRIANGHDAPFTDESVAAVTNLSSGIPRLINTLCDNALLVAFAVGSQTVQPAHIAEAARDLHLIPSEPAPAPQDRPPEPGFFAVPPPRPGLRTPPAAVSHEPEAATVSSGRLGTFTPVNGTPINGESMFSRWISRLRGTN